MPIALVQKANLGALQKEKTLKTDQGQEKDQVKVYVVLLLK